MTFQHLWLKLGLKTRTFSSSPALYRLLLPPPPPSIHRGAGERARQRECPLSAHFSLLCPEGFPGYFGSLFIPPEPTLPGNNSECGGEGETLLTFAWHLTSIRNPSSSSSSIKALHPRGGGRFCTLGTPKSKVHCSRRNAPERGLPDMKSASDGEGVMEKRM